MKSRLFAIFVTAAMLEVASTTYINEVVGHSASMMIWAALGAWFNFPFTTSMVESETMRERFLITAALSAGYGFGSAVVYFIR